MISMPGAFGLTGSAGLQLKPKTGLAGKKYGLQKPAKKPNVFGAAAEQEETVNEELGRMHAKARAAAAAADAAADADAAARAAWPARCTLGEPAFGSIGEIGRPAPLAPPCAKWTACGGARLDGDHASWRTLGERDASGEPSLPLLLARARFGPARDLVISGSEVRLAQRTRPAERIQRNASSGTHPAGRDQQTKPVQ